MLTDSQCRSAKCKDNLQGLFTAVVHYDLSWNPTRH